MSTVAQIPQTPVISTPPCIEDFTGVPRVAYFSMEIAIREEMPTYAGGLGILAGDLMRSAADLGVAMVGVSLVSRRGYFRQAITPEGDQIEKAAGWDPAHFGTRLTTSVCVRIAHGDVWVDAWLVRIDSPYGGDEAYRLSQETVLGIGGARMLRALGFNIREYHMNEGHEALLALELLREERATNMTPQRALRSVRLRANFTTHTPIEAAHDRFPYVLVEQVLGDYTDVGLLRVLAGEHDLNMTRLALEMSGMVNGVSRLQANGTLADQRIRSVSNGVHSRFWTCAPMAALFDRYGSGVDVRARAPHARRSHSGRGVARRAFAGEKRAARGDPQADRGRARPSKADLCVRPEDDQP